MFIFENNHIRYALKPFFSHLPAPRSPYFAVFIFQHFHSHQMYMYNLYMHRIRFKRALIHSRVKNCEMENV